MEKHKYKPGDRVVIVDDLHDKTRLTFTSEMERRAGTVMTVREYGISSYGPCYYMVEDQHEVTFNLKPGWIWDEKWIVGLESDTGVDQNELMDMLV